MSALVRKETESCCPVWWWLTLTSRKVSWRTWELGGPPSGSAAGPGIGGGSEVGVVWVRWVRRCTRDFRVGGGDGHARVCGDGRALWEVGQVWVGWVSSCGFRCWWFWWMSVCVSGVCVSGLWGGSVWRARWVSVQMVGRAVLWVGVVDEGGGVGC